jgi:phage tail protein X
VGLALSVVHITRQGETVDLACWLHYRRTREVTERVLAVNPGLAALGPVLPIGTRIGMPVIDARPAAPPLVKLWD